MRVVIKMEILVTDEIYPQDLKRNKIPKHLKYFEQQGVYFLWNSKTLIYVGKSTNIRRRLIEHKRAKKFTSYSFIPIDDVDKMSLLEAYFIVKYKPKLNKKVW